VRAATALISLALVAACSGTGSSTATGTPSPSPTTSTAGSPTASPTPSPTASRLPDGFEPVTKVLTVVFENEGRQEALRRMPYLESLAASYAHTTRYAAARHPSLPNYLTMAGGSTFGVSDDRGPETHSLAGQSVFDVVRDKGARSKVYAEAMPEPCATRNSGTYVVRHNPWAYFTDAASRKTCVGHDVPAGTPAAGVLHDDVKHELLPEVGLLVPDLCHDGHDCALSKADAWLQGWMKVVLAGPDWASGRLAVVLTFDEAQGASTEDVLTVVVSQHVAKKVVTAPLSHLSWCRWMTDLVGAAPLRQAATATSLGRAVGL
jgi:acid phosphatase